MNEPTEKWKEDKWTMNVQKNHHKHKVTMVC